MTKKQLKKIEKRIEKEKKNALKNIPTAIQNVILDTKKNGKSSNEILMEMRYGENDTLCSK